MATVTCYSGGKVVKTIKGLTEDDMNCQPIFAFSSQAWAHGIDINARNEKDGKRYLLFSWRGDYCIDWKK